MVEKSKEFIWATSINVFGQDYVVEIVPASGLINYLISHLFSGPARGFGYTVPRAVSIQVYGISLSQLYRQELQSKTAKRSRRWRTNEFILMQNW